MCRYCTRDDIMQMPVCKHKRKHAFAKQIICSLSTYMHTVRTERTCSDRKDMRYGMVWDLAARYRPNPTPSGMGSYAVSVEN